MTHPLFPFPCLKLQLSNSLSKHFRFYLILASTYSTSNLSPTFPVSPPLLFVSAFILFRKSKENKDK